MIHPDLTSQERLKLFKQVVDKIENYYSNTKDFRATPELDLDKIRNYINQFDFNSPPDFNDGLAHLLEGLEKYTVHTPHPKYFGLFNPRSVFPGILADLITAAYNPQLAAWSHSPLANEIENYLVRELGLKVGYPVDSIDGVFCSGGAEANLSAVLCALENAFPEYAENGLMGLTKRPVIYCSSEAHHSVKKAAKFAGLGYGSVHEIPARSDLRLNQDKLKTRIEEDIENGDRPFMLIATAGTTGTGAIDELPLLAKIAKANNLWFHIDAAYGGAAVLNRDLKPFLSGIERSDSVTFDAHKWLSVPMGASLLLTSRNDILARTFRISTEYMPSDARGMDITDPYTHSMQWSRRFTGLKLYLSLLFFGWKGYSEVIAHQARMGNVLREKLKLNGWSVMNPTVLPVVCFTDLQHSDTTNFSTFILNRVLESGKSWISVYPVNGISCFRACITNYNTSEEDLEELVVEMNQYREMFVKM